jgi:hypothetical protein
MSVQTRVQLQGYLIALVALACQPKARGEGGPADSVPSPPPAGMAEQVPAGGKEPVRTVRELLASDADVGRTVRVAGRCAGYSTPLAEGAPPLTRSDWQLEDEGVAIYVSGPLPAGCSATGGSQARSTIVAQVAQDTMPAAGDRPAAPRRYLVRARP